MGVLKTAAETTMEEATTLSRLQQLIWTSLKSNVLRPRTATTKCCTGEYETLLSMLLSALLSSLTASPSKTVSAKNS